MKKVLFIVMFVLIALSMSAQDFKFEKVIEAVSYTHLTLPTTSRV